MRRQESLSNTNIYEKKNRFSVRAAKAVGGIGLTGAALFAGTMGGVGEAHADNQIIAGGRGDSTSQVYTQFLINTHQINPATDKIFPVVYPAEIKPLDNTSMRDSVNQGVATSQNILDTQVDPHQKTHVWGYSEGSAVALESANKNKGRVSAVTIDKSPYGPGGISHNPGAKSDMVQSFAADNGLIVNEPLPTNIPVMVESNPDDGWSGAGNKVLETIQQLSDAFQATMNGDAHAPSDPTQPHNVQHFGNVTVEWFGNSPLPTIALDQSPVPAVVTDAPAPEVPQVLVGSVAPAPKAEHLAAPEFPGEAQCPGGYYTPGDAPC